MCTTARRLGRSASLVLILASALGATTVPRLTFEQLTDASEMIASGRVTQSWGAWDTDHKYIWTHYVLNVGETFRGTPAARVEFAEPGGMVGGSSLVIAGSVTYAIGSDVVVFLSRMPNGYLRTAGWAQGKYELDSNGRLHGVATPGAEMIDSKTTSSGSSLTTLEGLSMRELKQRVAVRVRATVGRVQ